MAPKTIGSQPSGYSASRSAEHASVGYSARRSASFGAQSRKDKKVEDIISRKNAYPPLPTYLWRTMEACFDDMFWLEPRPSPDWAYPKDKLHEEHEYMRHLAVHCIGDGNTGTRLMPCCTNFEAARHWHRTTLASGRNNTGFLVRMRVEDIGEEKIIDASPHRARTAYFKGDLEAWGDLVSRDKHF